MTFTRLAHVDRHNEALASVPVADVGRTLMRIQSLLGAAAVAGMMLVGVPAMAQTDPMAAPAADPAMAQPMMKKPMMKRHMSHRSMMMHHRKMMMHHKHKMMMHKKMM